ncbi:MAG TPA: hypothetical protein VK327_08350, partial [Candidatus Paceibacterota bacterium]|nr:hypothetical protein [Candidatus Paceibacterota bacterium]
VQLNFHVLPALSGNQIQFSWPADHTGWRLQMQTNGLGGAWLDVLHANDVAAMSLPMTCESAFFRLVYP